MFRLSPLIILVLCLCITGSLAYKEHSLYRSESAARFAALVQDAEEKIKNRFVLYEQVLLGARGFFKGSRHVDLEEWQTYVSSMNVAQHLPGILGIGYIEHIRNQAELDQFLVVAQQDGIEEFKNYPLTDFQDKFVIKYIEPLHKNKEAVGLDIGFEAHRREAAEFARDTGFLSLTKIIELVQDAQKTPGFLLLLPVYETLQTPPTVEERQKKLAGWVYAPFIGRSFIEELIVSSGITLDFRVFDGFEKVKVATIFQSAPDDFWSAQDRAFATSVIELVSGSIVWTLEWASPDLYVSPLLITDVRNVVIVGVIISMLVSGMFFFIHQLYGGATLELRATQERIELAFEASQDGLWDWDLVKDEFYVAPKFRRLLGYDPDDTEDFPNIFSKTDIHLHPDDTDKVLAAVKTHLEDQTPYDVEFRLITKRGEYKYFRARGNSVRNPEGNPVRMVGSIVDISDRKAYEQQLKKARKEAERANQMKSEFLAGMSHEIRTPMNGVMGTASLLARTKLNEKQRQYLDVIMTSGQTLLQIINEVLDFSKLEAGKLEIHEDKFSLRHDVESLMSLFEPLARAKNLGYQLQFDDNIPDWIVSDNTRVRQVLSNLLSNAIKFTETGQVTLSAEIDSEDETKIKFSVRDTGVGIEPDMLGDVFQEYQQMKEGRKATKTEGTGLGLSISKELVVMMGGKIGVDSKLGEGTTFWFTIPLKIPADDAEESVVKTKSANDTKKPRPINAKVLVAEDVPTNQFIITDMLENLGCQVEIAEDGAVAVKLVQEKEYDLVLMDCNMPVMDGFEATIEIRNLGLTDLPIVALTANALAGDQEKCLGVGMNDFVSKPCTQEMLADVLEKWLSAA